MQFKPIKISNEDNKMCTNFIIKSKDKLPQGEVELKAVYDVNEDKTAVVTLYVNGEEVGQGPVNRTHPGQYSLSETFDVGVDLGSPVALDYFEGIRYEAKGGKNKGNVRQFKKRKITQVNRDMIPYYKKSTQTLGQYVREMAENIENAKLWDRLGTKVVDLDDVDRNSSIAQLISKKVGSGEIDTQSAENLRGLLEARFVGGKKA